MPLLPPETVITETFIAAAPHPPAQPSRVEAPPETPAEPEITIHIGRLDIAAPASPPAPAKPRRERPPMRSLESYLNGGKS
ncbi:hypothetical protein PVT71_21720 [Salipiger sp. H15]|uniref:Uncharacterized protein n=1 Tax=Alloyangia sp. H15 TaxID=3029062 RepID=A0AAU8ALH5_9RHOB